MDINGASLIIGRTKWKPINSWKRRCLVDLKVFAINSFFSLVIHVPQSTRWDYRNERTILLGDRALPRTTPVHPRSTNLLQNTKEVCLAGPWSQHSQGGQALLTDDKRLVTRVNLARSHQTCPLKCHCFYLLFREIWHLLPKLFKNSTSSVKSSLISSS